MQPSRLLDRAIKLILLSSAALPVIAAEQSSVLDEVVVTAQKR
jgi:hypothetical protein